MGELAQAMNMMQKARMSTAILRYPSGRYGLVGSVPAQLTKPQERCLTPGARVSMAWNTEQEAINALLSIGINKFQLSNCSWYQAA